MVAARAADPRYGSRVVDVEVDYDGERCLWAVTDEGPGFDVERVLQARQEDADALLRPWGRGILLMKAFLDDVRFEAGGRRVLLTLRRTSGEEKRRQPRLAVQRPVRVAPIRPDGSVDWGAACEAVSRNLSADGMAILQARLASSSRVLIGIDWDGQLLQVPAEVRHCRPVQGDVVEIGCRFQPPPAAAESGVERAVGALLDRIRGQPHPPAPVGLAPRVLALPQADDVPLRVVAQILRWVPIMEGVFDVGACFLGLEGA
jgi:hypothetical protein